MTNSPPPPSSDSTVIRARETWTVAKVLKWLADDLKSRSIESPRLEAELLVAHVLGCDRLRLIIDRERPLDSQELANLRKLVMRRRRNEPIAYLLGEREFFGLPMKVDDRVLIPRPDTETLVETALSLSEHRNLHGKLLDLCTGSGNVAIAFCKQRPTWQVMATDTSERALEVARSNAERLCDLWNLSFWQGDLFAALPPRSVFHVIVSNPPYIPSREVDQLEPHIRDHEPRLALDGGPDGLDIIRRIVRNAPRYLVPGGWLAMEMAMDQGAAVSNLLRAAGFSEVDIVRDLANRERVAIGRKPVPQT